MKIARIRRATLLPVLLATITCSQAFSAETISTDKAKVEKGTAWYDAKLLTIEGQGWKDVASLYDRLPARAKEKVRGAVWGLSQDSAGICVRFKTDASNVSVRWTLRDKNLAMPHMPATGVSGVDLYVQTDSGKLRWLANGRPAKVENQAQLVSGIPAKMRSYVLYLPLYNGVSSVHLGVNVKASVETWPRSEENQKPVVFYGTSITQGGCASRPGMVHTAILGRWLDRPVINLGFSGNGRMEIEVAELMSELDPAVYVIDCLPNIAAAQVTERTAPLVKKLRSARPDTPILLVEDRNYTNGFLLDSRRKRNQESQQALQKVYQQLKAEGVDGLYYLEGEKLLGDDGEDTVDSSHPTDLGFYRQAEAFYPVLRDILK